MSVQSPLLEPSRCDGFFFNSLKKKRNKENKHFKNDKLWCQSLKKWCKGKKKKTERKAEYLFDEVPGVDGQVRG